jgi:hypothetical protein
LLIAGGLMVVAARMTHRAWVSARRTDAQMKALEEVPIRSALAGHQLTAVRGQTDPSLATTHPLTGERVAQYEIRVEQGPSHAIQGKPLELIYKERSAEVVVLQDATGRVEIPMVPEVTLELDDCLVVYDRQLPQPVQRYLDGLSNTVPQENDDRKITVTSRWIPVQRDITAIGYPVSGGQGVTRLVSTLDWQVLLTFSSVEQVRSSHRSSASLLKWVTVGFVVAGLAHLVVAGVLYVLD